LSRALGKRAEAIAGFQQAIDVWMPLLEEFPELDGHRNSMASHANSLAVLLREDGRFEDAYRMHEQAIAHRLKLVTAAPKSPNYAASLRNYYEDYCETALVRGDHAAAAQITRLMSQVRPDVAADAQLAARFFCRCLRLAEQDEALADDERVALAQSYAAEAVKQLCEAVRRGFKDVAILKSDTELVPLQNRPLFQQLVEALEAR
jgi:hypothetical protein